jgi:hypothetical protein
MCTFDKAKNTYKIQSNSLVREDVTQGYDRKGSLAGRRKITGATRGLAPRRTDWM